MALILYRLLYIGRDRRGVVAAEYAVLSVGVIIAVGIAVVTLSDPNTSAFAVMGRAVSSIQADMPSSLASR
jgi:Flp pilus assembly pilin Flp